MKEVTLEDLNSTNHDILFMLRKITIKLEYLTQTADFVKFKMDGPKLEDMYNLSQVCILLDVSKRTVQRMRSQKLIKYYVVSGKSYYPKTDVDKLVAKRRKIKK